MATTVADVMVATLRASGVQRVYGIPGDSLNGFTDSLRRDGAIAWEHVRHEEAAAFAAAAEAALTGELAVWYRSSAAEKSACSTRYRKAKVRVSLVVLARSANCCRVRAATMTRSPSEVAKSRAKPPRG
jgi:glyoxylate carboligase